MSADAGTADDYEPAEGWQMLALCRQTDSELWFPEVGRPDVTRAARRICRACPVQPDCLAFITAWEDEHVGEWGMWGGLTAHERAVLRRRRAA